MQDFAPPVTTLLAGLAALVGVLWYRQRSKPALPLAPGPKRSFIFGNALQMPKASGRPWLTHAKWAQEFGDVYSLDVLGRSIVVLSSVESITEILEKRSSLSSERPRLVLAGQICGFKHSIPLSSPGPRHKEYRRLLQAAMSPAKLASFHAIHVQKTAEFMQMLLESPQNLREHIRRAVSSTILQISHGYTPTKGKDPLLELVEKSDRDFMSTIPGAFLVEVIPALQYVPAWFPGAQWKRDAMVWAARNQACLRIPYEMVKDQVKAGTAAPSFAAELVERNAPPGSEQESIYTHVTISMLKAGTDTTVASIAAFFLAMTLYPEVQRKAQLEIQKVIGTERLPRVDDLSSLPYVAALMREVHRWQPAANLGFPHVLSEDTVYRDYLLPKGSVIIPNSRAVMHNPSIYDNPMEFKPERFLGENPELDPRDFAFGFGRRACPGRALAEDSLFIAIAMTLAVFDIKKPLNVEGVEYNPDLQFTSGLISHPEPFDCRIEPRSKEVVELVEGLF